MSDDLEKMTDAELKGRIRDATGEPVLGNPSRETLLKRAAEAKPADGQRRPDVPDNRPQRGLDETMKMRDHELTRMRSELDARELELSELRHELAEARKGAARESTTEPSVRVQVTKTVTIDANTNEKVKSGEVVEMPLKQAREFVVKKIAAWADPHPDVV